MPAVSMGYVMVDDTGEAPSLDNISKVALREYKLIFISPN